MKAWQHFRLRFSHPAAAAPVSVVGVSTAGLRDVVALTSSVASIEDGVLCYRGINIDELAENATFEEVIHLLWHGKLPTRVDQLANNGACPG